MIKMADEKGVTIIGPATVRSLISPKHVCCKMTLSNCALDCECSVIVYVCECIDVLNHECK